MHANGLTFLTSSRHLRSNGVSGKWSRHWEGQFPRAWRYKEIKSWDYATIAAGCIKISTRGLSNARFGVRIFIPCMPLSFFCSAFIVGNGDVEDDRYWGLLDIPFSAVAELRTSLPIAFAAIQAWCGEFSIQRPDKTSNVFGVALRGIEILQTVAMKRCESRHWKWSKWIMQKYSFFRLYPNSCC